MERGFSIANLKHWWKHFDPIIIMMFVATIFLSFIIITNIIELIGTEFTWKAVIGIAGGSCIIWTYINLLTDKVTIKNLWWVSFSPWVLSYNDIMAEDNNLNGIELLFLTEKQKHVKEWLDDYDIIYHEVTHQGRTKIFPKKPFKGIVFKSYDDMIYTKIGYDG